jgi:hypothetical protein
MLSNAKFINCKLAPVAPGGSKKPYLSCMSQMSQADMKGKEVTNCSWHTCEWGQSWVHVSLLLEKTRKETRAPQSQGTWHWLTFTTYRQRDISVVAYTCVPLSKVLPSDKAEFYKQQPSSTAISFWASYSTSRSFFPQAYIVFYLFLHILFYLSFVEIGSHYVGQAGLELMALCHPSAGITGVCHHVWLFYHLLNDCTTLHHMVEPLCNYRWGSRRLLVFWSESCSCSGGGVVLHIWMCSVRYALRSRLVGWEGLLCVKVV